MSSISTDKLMLVVNTIANLKNSVSKEKMDRLNNISITWDNQDGEPCPSLSIQIFE